MKTGTKVLALTMIVLGALATSIFAQSALANPIAARDCTQDQDRVRDRLHTCDGDGNCNCTGQGSAQTLSQEKFRNAYHYEEMWMEKYRFGRD
ncbi:MAG: hypothetical protein QW231_03440 [Candidatus Bathyarchaeia archaeon]